MNEEHFGSNVRRALEEGLPMDDTMAARLKVARERALAHHRPQPVAALAWSDNVVGRLGGWSGLAMRVLLPLLLVVVVAGGLYSWQKSQRLAELEEIDAQLLTDELPIDAYLDRGFQNWLKKRRGTF